MEEASDVETEISQEDSNARQSWACPCSDIIRLIINHLKLVDRWKWEGRSLRMTNRAWCRVISQSITKIRPHQSRLATLSTVVRSSAKFRRATTVDMSGCSGRCTEESFEDLLGLSQLHTVKLSGLCVSDSGMPMLAKSRSIKNLSLVKVLVTNVGLEAVGKMEQLESLELKWLDVVTNRCLDSVKGVSQLKLTLCSGIGDEGMSILRHYKQLSHLTAMLTGLTDVGLEAVMDLTNLTSLVLLCQHSNGSGLSKVSQMTNLKDLCLREMKYVEWPRGIAKLPQLENLSIHKAVHLDLDCIAAMDLKSLKLYGLDAVQRADLAKVARIKSLTELGIGQLDIVRSADLSGVCQLSGITKLNLQGCQNVGNSGVALVCRLKNLTELFLHSCDRVGKPGIEHLVSLQCLEKLTVGPNIDDDCVSVLSSMPKLRNLGFVLCNALTIQGLRQLRRMGLLRDLCLDWCNALSTTRTQDFKALAKLFFIDLDHLGLHPFKLSDDALRQIQEIAPPLKIDSNVNWVWEW